jgi:hypothetical protein
MKSTIAYPRWALVLGGADWKRRLSRSRSGRHPPALRLIGAEDSLGRNVQHQQRPTETPPRQKLRWWRASEWRKLDAHQSAGSASGRLPPCQARVPMPHRSTQPPRVLRMLTSRGARRGRPHVTKRDLIRTVLVIQTEPRTAYSLNHSHTARTNQSVWLERCG